MSNGVGAAERFEEGESRFLRFVRWLRDLFSSRRESYRSSSDLFLELDLQAVRAILRPKERGRENGVRNLPRSDGAVRDQVEQEVIAFFVNEQKRAHEQCQLQLDVFTGRVRDLEIRILHSNAGARMQAAAADLRALALSGRNELFESQQKVTALTRELENFRGANRLTREAHYPESRLWHWAVLVVILLIETALNGLMLSRGTVGGLLEGFTQALGLAALNVFIGALIGRVALSLLHHVRLTLRTLGGAVLGIGIVGSVSFNLAVGHYRDALGGPSPETAARDALVSFLANPFNLADLSSWTLCALGLFFAFIATIDTHGMDDRYWGYGAISRRSQTARDDFIAERQDLIEQAVDQRDEALEAIHRVGEQIARAGQHRLALAQQQQHVLERFSGYQGYLEQTAEVLLSEYRAENQAARNTPPPSHFFEQWHLPRISVPPPPSVPDGLRTLSTGLKHQQDEIMTAFDEAVAAIKSVEDLIDAGQGS